MNIQESNNITVSDIEIKEEKFEESSSVKRSVQNISEESSTEENFSSKDCEFVKHETVIFEAEEDDIFEEVAESKYNEGGIKDECFQLPEFITHEDIDIKTEYQEEDQSNSNYEESITKKGEGEYRCDKCNFETRWKKSLGRHIQTHDKVKYAPKYPCKQCTFQAIDKLVLEKHLKMHNYFSLICIFCQKSFKQEVELEAHYVSRHSGSTETWLSTITNKINECPKCLYKTVNIIVFKKHLTTHGITADQAHFKCTICGYKCACLSNYMAHLRVHVGQLPFACTECDRKFNKKQQFDGHIITQHSDNEELIRKVTSKVHWCVKCDFKTVHNTNFKTHLKACL